VAQLNKLTGVSRAIAGSPVAVTVVRHIIRESEYFLCVLATLLEPRETPEFDAGSHAASQYGAVAGELPETGRPQGANNGPAGNLPHGGAPYAVGTPQHAAHGGDPYAGVPGGFGSPAFDAPDTAGMPRDANNQRLEADRKHITSASVPIGGHALPPLPYPYDALEPHIDKETMRIHHDKHHQSYVDGLNKAEKELEKARQTGDYALVKHWERELAFNGAGHYLHTLFWNVMSPHGGGTASGAMARQIAQDFGSFEAFRNHFSNAAEKVEGGGWAILVWSPRSRRLEILTAEKHQNLSQWDAVPVLPLDVWEHAYYLKHQNKRADYIQAWWNVVNWPYVNQRFTEASRLVWPPY
jgi:Fe-Mn family superoxide dismutase